MFSQKVKHFMEYYFKRSLSPLPSVNPVVICKSVNILFSLPKAYNGFNGVLWGDTEYYTPYQLSNKKKIRIQFAIFLQ